MKKQTKSSTNGNFFRRLFRGKDISRKYKWSIIFLRNDVPQYKMLSENVVKMLGYYMIKFGNCEKILEPWKLELHHNKSGKNIYLTKHYFPNPNKIREELFDKIENIDPGYEVTSLAEIVFIDCSTGKKIPLSSVYNLTITSVMNKDNLEPDFFDVLDSIFD